MNRGTRLLTMVGICLAMADGYALLADEPPCELGMVNWTRDFAAAKQHSAGNGKPILMLFQEVPGCQTCQDFGNQPLSHPLLVEAIEELFIPVLVYNNKPEDANLLKSFDEPSWNNPVIRYLDSKGKDLIPRKDRVWKTIPTARRMIESLIAAGQDVPVYLKLMADRHDQQMSKATFAMHCFWEGEAKLGKLDGVQATRSAWVGDKEVVEVTFDEQTIGYQTLLDSAQSMECASMVYAHDENQLKIAKQTSDNVEAIDDQSKTRDAKDSDQKYYLQHSVYRHLPLSESQAVKVNAQLFPKVDHKTARSYLSPRQLRLLSLIQQRLDTDKSAMDGFAYPKTQKSLADYDRKLRKHLGLSE